MNSQFNKGVIEMCILALVAKKDYYGYELVDNISKHIEISEGSVYPILRRLTKEKYFTTYLKESTEGPPRKYYRLTKTGEKYTNQLTIEWKTFTQGVSKLIEG